MRAQLRQIDQILRGEATRPDALRSGRLELPVAGLCGTLIVLGMLYGLGMGSFALLRPDGPVYAQWIATTIKVPALFFLTLLVTCPSLYVFNALVGSRLNVVAVVRLLIASLAVNLAVLASLGPIVAFFSVSTTSYPFMVLLNVVCFSVSGALGLVFLLQTLHRLSLGEPIAAEPLAPSETTVGAGGGEVQPVESPEQAGNEMPRTQALPGPLDRLEDHVLGKHVRTIFRIWVFVFALVGAQMGWVLRPFIGDPALPFEWLRDRQSNFFEAVLRAITQLFAG